MPTATRHGAQSTPTRIRAGDAYGTTVYGGNGLCQNGEQSGCGTIFQVDAAGKEKILYNFAGKTDEGFPQGGLALDAAGNLYGTTTSGYFSTGYGTAFKLSPQGKLTLLHNFTDSTDGGFPFGTVAWDSTGHLYGTTGNGGDPSFGCGVVFEVTP